jgi:hypothetical protein
LACISDTRRRGPTPASSAGSASTPGASPFGGASFGITVSNFLLVSETPRNHCRPSPCDRLSRPPRQVVTPATTTAAPPHPWSVGRRCAQPDARRWPRRHRADQGWFPCSLVDRSAEEASDSAPATSPWLPRSTSPGLPSVPPTCRGVPRLRDEGDGCASPPAQIRQVRAGASLRGVERRFLAYTFPPRSPHPRRLAVPTRHGFVRAAPTRPGTSRGRLPSASQSCCDRTTVQVSHLNSINKRLTAHRR